METRCSTLTKARTFLTILVIGAVATFASVRLYGLEFIGTHIKYVSVVLKPSFRQSKHIDFTELADKFELLSKDILDSFGVLGALKRDGYTPELLSIHDSELPQSLSAERKESKKVLSRNETVILPLVTSTPRTITSTGKRRGDVSSSRPLVTTTARTITSTGKLKGKLNGASTTLHPKRFVTSAKADVTTQPLPTIKVPNVVHYVLIGSDLKFMFTHYLSFRSVERFIKPDQIFIHGDHIPFGLWWNRTILEVRNIYLVNTTYSKMAPNGQPYKFPAHISDYKRNEILLRYGGIYLDGDVVVVKSFTPLRRYSCVMGREDSQGLCNSIIIARKGSPFLRLVIEQYRSYLGKDEVWSVKSVINTDKIARLYPHLIHVEDTSLNRPNWLERGAIYDGLYNWKNNYAVHLWIRLWPGHKKPNGFNDILTQNTTFGEIGRYAIFGFYKLVKNNTVYFKVNS